MHLPIGEPAGPRTASRIKRPPGSRRRVAFDNAGAASLLNHWRMRAAQTGFQRHREAAVLDVPRHLLGIRAPKMGGSPVDTQAGQL
jgi:hypothetical protein